MRHKILIVLGVIVLAGFVLYFISRPVTTKTLSEDKSVPQMELLGYVDYSDSRLSISQNSGKSVLFFAATSWCTTCSRLDQEIKSRANEIPAGVTILKVDYDRDDAMKQKYGIVVQHTLVILGNEGSELARWAGGDFDDILKKINET